MFVRTINTLSTLLLIESDSQTDNRSSRVRGQDPVRLAKGSRRFELLLLPLCGSFFRRSIGSLSPLIIPHLISRLAFA